MDKKKNCTGEHLIQYLSRQHTYSCKANGWKAQFSSETLTCYVFNVLGNVGMHLNTRAWLQKCRPLEFSIENTESYKLINILFCKINLEKFP